MNFANLFKGNFGDDVFHLFGKLFYSCFFLCSKSYTSNFEFIFFFPFTILVIEGLDEYDPNP
jgi:hypothetical protein